MEILLAPSVKLVNWSFDAEVTESGYEWQNKPIYLINYVEGLTGTPFEFWIDLEVSGRGKCNVKTEAHNGFRKTGKLRVINTLFLKAYRTVLRKIKKITKLVFIYLI
jgi:hypothetical protein